MLQWHLVVCLLYMMMPHTGTSVRRELNIVDMSTSKTDACALIHDL